MQGISTYRTCTDTIGMLTCLKNMSSHLQLVRLKGSKYGKQAFLDYNCSRELLRVLLIAIMDEKWKRQENKGNL